MAVIEFGEHPGAEDHSQTTGLGQDDLSVRVPTEIRFDLSLQDGDLLVQRSQDSDQRSCGRGVGGGDNGGLGKVFTAQRSLDRRGLLGHVSAPATGEDNTDLRDAQLGRARRIRRFSQ
jgi:hypothetical protein